MSIVKATISAAKYPFAATLQIKFSATVLANIQFPLRNTYAYYATEFLDFASGSKLLTALMAYF